MPLGSLTPTATLATRRGITWGLDAPLEDSSVLVTGTPSGHYIDIRFALEGPSTQSVFWAFAGTSKYTPLVESSGNGIGGGWEEIIRGEWAHPIDSMGNFEGKDHADIITLPNGDQIETGLLEHPETGKPSQFKEYWTKPEDSQVKTPIVRASHNHETRGGVMIRVGNWIQAIRQVSQDRVEVGRWRMNGGECKEDNLSSQSRSETFPIDWIVGNRDIKDSITVEGRTWVIEEVA